MSSSGLERRHLTALAALLQHQGFAQAAAALFVTPSTFATSIRQAERLVGSRLVERTSSGMRLNERGLVVAESAAAALRAIDDLLEDARRSSGSASGSLFVQTTPTLAESHGADLLSNLLARHPGLRLAVRAPRRPIVADVAFAVAAGEADLGMTERMTRPIDGIVQVPLGSVEVAYAFPANSGVRPRKVDSRHLDRFGLIVVPHFESSDTYGELRHRSPTVSQFVRARVTERHAFADLALRGVAGFLCEYSNRDRLAAMGLHVAPFKDPFTRRFVTIARTDDRRAMIIEALAESRRIAHAIREKSQSQR